MEEITIVYEYNFCLFHIITVVPLTNWSNHHNVYI